MIGTVVWCDAEGCPARTELYTRKVTTIRKRLAQRGWTVRADPNHPTLPRTLDWAETLCPDHKPDDPAPATS